MKNSKKIIIIILSVFLLLLIGFILYHSFINNNTLSNDEKKWLDQNLNKVLSVSIPNDIPVFGDMGEGVFYDFVDYLNKELGISVNKSTNSYLNETTGYGFEIKDSYDNNKLLLFKDHFVLISKNAGIVYDKSKIVDLKVGINKNNLNIIKKYYNAKDEQFVMYDNYQDITKDLNNGNLQYALVPLNEYKSELISNGINILAHVSDLNKYYYFRLSDDSIANSILTKEFNDWKNKKFYNSFNSNNYKLFINKLGITEADETTLTNREYHYGFTENRPYEILESGEYGGITAQYLRSFSDFSGVDFTYKKYSNATKLAEAAINGDVDLYYNYFDIITNFIDCGALGRIDYEIIAHNSIDLSLSNINGLEYRDVYVLKDSYLYGMIKNLPGINVITYNTPKDLKKIVKNKAIIVLDSNTSKYYLNKLTNEYTSRYHGTYENNNYSFRYKNNSDTFYKLFNAYTKTIDPNDLIRLGITTYNNVEQRGNLSGSIARYALVVIIVSFATLLIVKNNKRKVKVNTKVKKEDRLKYIDILTSLKNRNYFNDRLPIWNKNTVYPQGCIVFDINNVKVLNDSFGHEEGDKLIQSVANVLIRTQIDNTEIIRTDGNEFLIYLVGYSEKQILSYIKKITKGFKKLPHDGTVAVGFSIIEDDAKLVEDCYNEALIKMRENKENTYEQETASKE